MQLGTLSETTQPSRLIMMPRGLKAGLITMHLGHCAGKLVRVIWKMLTDEVEFNLE